MARNAKEGVTTKRNSKLESFLKINLPENVYDRIIAYEPCIVDHRKEKKAFKYVVLSAERIFLTENPPKTIREEEGVPLGELISVDLVNEFPEFLNGEERDNCQHIFIKYHAKETSKQRKKGGGDKHGSGTDEGSSSGGNSPLPELILTEPNGSTLDASKHPSRSSSMRSLKLNRSLDESDLKSLRDMSIDSDSDSEDRLSWSMPSGDLENMSIHSLESLSLGSGEMLAGDRGKGKISGVETCRPLPHRPTINRGQQQRSIDKPDSYSSQIALSLENREANRATSPTGSTSSKSQLRNLPSPEPSDTDKSKSKPFQFPMPEKEGSKKGFNSLIPLSRHKSLDDGVPSKRGKGDNKENRNAADFLADYAKKE